MMAIIEDQASDLRESIDRKPSQVKSSRRLRCISVASGKGGVGKTVVSIGLGLCLAEMGYKVLMLDADLGLANVDIQLGVDPHMTVQDVVYGGKSIAEVVVNVKDGLDVLASSSGSAEMVDMGSARRTMFVDELLEFAVGYDYLLVDVAAGIGQSITTFLKASPEVIVVVANEPTSVMDAYALIKVLGKSGSSAKVHIVVNMVKYIDEGEALYGRLDVIVKRFVGKSYPCVGVIPWDAAVGDGIRARRPVLEYAPRSAAAICIREMAAEVVRRGRSGEGGGDIRDLLERIAGAGVSRSEEGQA